MQRDQSEYLKWHTIKHMIECVEIRLHQETGKIIKLRWPETDKDKAELKKMYDRALSKYS